MPVRVAGAGSGGRFRKVPEGSGRFRRIPACAGVGSGGGFRKVPDGSGVCWRRFRRWVPEGSERLVPEGLGRFWRVPESSGACWCRFQRQGSESSGGFRRVPASVGVGSEARVQ